MKKMKLRVNYSVTELKEIVQRYKRVNQKLAQIEKSLDGIISAQLELFVIGTHLIGTTVGESLKKIQDFTFCNSLRKDIKKTRTKVNQSIRYFDKPKKYFYT